MSNSGPIQISTPYFDANDTKEKYYNSATVHSSSYFQVPISLERKSKKTNAFY